MRKTRRHSGMDRLWALCLLIAPAMVSGGPATAAESDDHDPCSFVTVDEIETVMGKLAGPPYRTRGDATPRPNGSSCRYDTPDHRAIKLGVQWSGGKNLLAMMGAVKEFVGSAGLSQLKLVDGTTVAGHWDQAAFNGCCELNALRGDQVVAVDIAGSRATSAQAAFLADAAIQRLDHPLAISGAAGIQAAQDRASQRPRPRNVCDLLTRADAEAIAGVSLLQPPQGSNRSCHYVWPLNPQGIEYELDLKVIWQEGFNEMRTTNVAVGNASSMLGMTNLQAPATPDQQSGPWDEFSQSIIGVSAVKADVMVSVEGGPIRQDIQREFVRKAIMNLGQ